METSVPIFVINLDRRRDRLDQFSRAASDLGLPFERISAVDGRLEDIKARAERAPLGFMGRPLGPFGLACFESHRNAWRRLVEAGDPFALVVEDDVVFAPDILKVVQRHWIPEYADIVRLEAMPESPHLDRRPVLSHAGRQLFRLRSRTTGTGAYLIGKHCARFLLGVTMDIADPVDEVLFNERSTFFRKLSIWQMVPAPAIQGRLLDAKLGEGWVESDLLAEVRAASKEMKTSPRFLRLARQAKKGAKGMLAQWLYPRRKVLFG